MTRVRKSRRAEKRLTFGRAALLAVAALALGGMYFVASYQSSTGVAGFPFPCAVSEGTALHVHPYLRILINGESVTIPSGIGDSPSCVQPVHTHDASGVIHIESPNAAAQYTLGQFIQTWSATYEHVTVNGSPHPIVFNSTDIMGFKADASHRVVLLVDGKPSSNYASLVLNPLDYCSAVSTLPPCYPTAGGSPPYYGGQEYPFGTGHTIVIEYTQ